ncbi:hypothetical protein [Labilithrix luteola]|nr:hypothetical protein [Labilithrix luteola]
MGLASCAGPTQRSAGENPARGTTSPAASAAPPGADAEPVATLDELAARGAVDAPLMKETLRADPAAPKTAEIRAERDLCVRAAFAASASVRAWFADASGDARGDAATGVSGLVPPRGPACAKKGEVLRLMVDAPANATMSRAVVWTSP